MSLQESIEKSRVHIEGDKLFLEPNIILPNNQYLEHLNINYFSKKSLFFGGVNCAGINDAVGDSRRGGGGEIF